MKTRTGLLIIAGCVVASGIFAAIAVANAQPAAQPFEPYTVTEQQHQAIMTFLGDVPSKWANPIANSLAQMEQAAQQRKAVEDAKKKAEQEKKDAK